MKYTINSLTHNPGISHYRQGIKKNQYSKFAEKNHVIAGSNGTYITVDDAKIYVYLTDENGNSYSSEIYRTLKELSNGKIFTKKFINNLKSKIENIDFEVNKGESVKETLNQVLKNALES